MKKSRRVDSRPTSPADPGLSLEPVDEVYGGEEAAAEAGTDAAASDRDHPMVFPVPVPPISTTLRCRAMIPPAASRGPMPR